MTQNPKSSFKPIEVRTDDTRPFETTITEGREKARIAIHVALGGKFSIDDVMCAATDILAEVVGASCESIEDAQTCAEAIGRDIAQAVRENWQELAWARQLAQSEAKGRS